MGENVVGGTFFARIIAVPPVVAAFDTARTGEREISKKNWSVNYFFSYLVRPFDYEKVMNELPQNISNEKCKGKNYVTLAEIDSKKGGARALHSSLKERGVQKNGNGWNKKILSRVTKTCHSERLKGGR
jgi:hypothetical protein